MVSAVSAAMSGASDPKLGILVGGGPAPGINGVISAVTIEAAKRGTPVLGLLDGFRWLMDRDATHARPLGIGDVSRIHLRGGSILRTSRANPTRDPLRLANVLHALEALSVRWLVTIGGDDTAHAAARLAEGSEGRLAVVHVPKTIDNDLPLPEGTPTFGFETARHEGVSVVRRLLEDATATGRWYVVVAMGRKAGHLALGIGKAAGAHLTLIPEEFPPGPVPLARLVDTLEGAVVKRRADGRADGVCVLAEGLAARLSPEDIPELEHAERDAHGHVRLAELPLGDVVKRALRARLADRGIELTVVAKDIGYELRCADPIPFDLEYTRDLGYGAARYVLDQGNAAMVTRQGGRIVPVPFGDMRDPETGRTRIRIVDTNCESYAVAREYMIRLEADDLKDPVRAEALARAGATTVADLRARFAEAVPH